MLEINVDNRLSHAYLPALSRAAVAFAGAKTTITLYHEIAEQLRELLGDSIVIVNAFEASTGMVQQRAIAGLPEGLTTAVTRMGVRWKPMRTKATPEAIEQMSRGRLLKIEEGLHELFLRQVPRVVTQALERMAHIREVCGMGCVAEGTCFGGIAFCLRCETPLPPVEIIEAFVHTAAVALKRCEVEMALQRSEDRYSMLMEHAADPSAVLSDTGHITQISKSALAELGYPRDRLLGVHLSDVMDPAERESSPFPWARVRARETFLDTRRLKRADQSYMTCELRLSPLPEGNVFLSARDVTYRHQLERAMMEAGEQERRAIGRDLHDSLGQQLTAMGYLAAALERGLSARGVPEAAQAGQIASLASEAVAQTRRMARGLCPVDISEDDLAISLEHLAGNINATGNVLCEAGTAGPVATINPTARIHLYQVAQEAAANAIQHGAAKNVTIHLGVTDTKGVLTIRDDGTGITVEENSCKGLGLRAMRYRAEMIEGTLDIQSDQTGTVVRCTFPCPDPSL